jgi:hypothetical protein
MTFPHNCGTLRSCSENPFSCYGFATGTAWGRPLNDKSAVVHPGQGGGSTLDCQAVDEGNMDQPVAITDAKYLES